MAGWVEKRGENKWRLNVPGGTGPDGKRKVFRKNVEAQSKREAEKLLDLFAAEVLRGQYVEPSKLTFGQFVERWLRDYAEPNLAPKTVHRYRQMLETRILPAMGHLKIEQIKPLHLMEFYKNLQEDGIREDGKPGGLSERTILHHHRLISAILQDAVEWQVIPSNPASRVKPPRVKKQQAASYDETQFAALMEALEQEPLKYRVMVVLAVASGLRRGELMALEWKDIDFQKGTLEVRRAAQYLPGRGQFTKEPKTEESRRVVTLPPSVMSLLKEYKRHQAQERLKVGDLWQGSDRLFTTWDGRPMHIDTISKWFPAFLKRHNLPPLPFHGLRHTHASLLIGQGVHAKTISARLGHSNISTTMDIYGHALKSADREAAEKLDGILAGKRKQGQA
ncbi:Site-specific recombinase XerD [Desulfofundulus australicus DSM 11792]|uniref:Site-specific recombinase XerD n=1 Tax=Desulfofundulus australicus DSM 11792 TaxID=1121425 RepID=A0A1M5E9I2_9FIRM|nr:tyrosine-type recombinase/integrase [Desulfofundulus australicus]SHF75840.1 Site-specific recombinase XerD [Desulfofundulus australicus DSM 11792]